MASTKASSTKPPTQFNRARLRAIAFHTHRWLGLIVGVLLCIAGVTGSILVFSTEIDMWLFSLRYGQIIPTDTPVPIPEIVERLQTAYAGKNLTLESLGFPERDNYPFLAWFLDAANESVDSLLAGDIGLLIEN